MSKSRDVKPTHKTVKTYYAKLEEYRQHHVDHESAVRSAFQNLLDDTAKSHGWFLVTEQRIRVKGKDVIPDGTLRDEYNLHRGYWEAKDTDDDLNKEIRKKIAKGYPLPPTIFPYFPWALPERPQSWQPTFNFH